jgi:hypothetical protein
MAEFKISRIRYTWRNLWNASTAYNRDDVIRYKAIHLMDKGANYNNLDENGEKFQCNETGAHFEFLEMCRRLKRL